MNAAVLLFSACLAGADPVPPPPPTAPAPVVAYSGDSGDCCGKSKCDDCCNKVCSCFKKIKNKLCNCWNKCLDKCRCDKCDQGCEQKPACPPQPVVVKQDCCGKATCCDKSCDSGMKGDCCGKSQCCDKIQSCCDKICWKPGYFLHKCKAKLCGLCDKSEGNSCCGGCGTAATPGGCGATVIPPANTVPPATKPSDPKKIPDKVGMTSPYSIITPGPITVSPAQRTIDLTGSSND